MGETDHTRAPANTAPNNSIPPDQSAAAGGKNQPAGAAPVPAKAVSRARRFAAGAGRLVTLVLLTVLVFAALVLIIVPKAAGSQTYTVLTKSMVPKYPPGTFLVVRPTPFSQLQYGDVITFQLESGKPAVESHRIVGFGSSQTGEKTLITKGDNNSVNDANPVRKLQVRGKLFYAVPYVGFVANALGNQDRGLWVSIGAAILIGYGVLLIIRNLRSMPRRPTEGEAAGTPAPGEETAGEETA
ncbi:signal peptidase I [Arthrobacter sp. NPDC056727]|uniref:signal peptidase I n=1 Tax=Arthrobacter sp. NPDC056727 TaxID=3345927 RepID=UPI003672EFD2